MAAAKRAEARSKSSADPQAPSRGSCTTCSANEARPFVAQAATADQAAVAPMQRLVGQAANLRCIVPVERRRTLPLTLTRTPPLPLTLKVTLTLPSAAAAPSP